MLANSEPEIISFVEEERRAFKRVKSMDKNGEQIASAVVSLNSSPGFYQICEFLTVQTRCRSY